MPEPRTKSGWASRHLRTFALALVVPGLLFCAISMSRGGICLDTYEWTTGEGYMPVPAKCGPDASPSLLASAGFYVKATGGLLTGRSGRSREDASRTLGALLSLRGMRSLIVLAVAIATLMLAAAASALIATVRSRLRRGPQPVQVPRGPLLAPGGLPLPIAGFLVFVAVIRLVPAGHALDYDRAGLIWAGVALGLADGAAAILLLGLRHTVDTEMARSYADSLRMWGANARAAVADVSRRVRAAQIRGAFLALISGLLVVEGIFGVNGLGEALKDLVVDRQGREVTTK